MSYNGLYDEALTNLIYGYKDHLEKSMTSELASKHLCGVLYSKAKELGAAGLLAWSLSDEINRAMDLYRAADEEEKEKLYHYINIMTSLSDAIKNRRD